MFEAAGADGPPLRQPGRPSTPDHDVVARRAEVLRSGRDAVVRVQPRRGDPRVQAGDRARCRRARCASGAWPSRWGRTSTRRSPRTAANEAYQAIEAGAANSAGPPPTVSAPTSTRSRSAMSPTRGGARRRSIAAYADAMRELVAAVPRRSRRVDAVRAVADGYVALELLEPGRHAAASSPTEVLDALESVLKRQARPCRGDPSVHPRRRSVAQSGPRRGVCREARGARCRAPATSCTCPATSTCGRVAISDASMANVRTPSRSTRRTSPATAVAGQHDVPDRLLPAQHPLLRRVRVARRPPRRRVEGRRRPAREDARGHAARPGDGRHGPALPPHAALREAALQMWDEVLAEPAPPADLPYMRAMWHAARGIALAARGPRDGGGAGTGRGGRAEGSTRRSRRCSSRASTPRRRSWRSRTRCCRRDRAIARTSSRHAALHGAGGGARGRTHLHGAARLADSGPSAAGRRAARARTRARRPKRLSAPT